MLTETPETTETLDGEVAFVAYADPASGFGVVELDADGARASGPLAGLVAGQSVRLVGSWKTHERYGPTFEAVYYEQAPPRSTDGLAHFLASEYFPGVGEVLAKRVVEAFGLELPSVIETEPERLVSVRGVSARIAEAVADGWRRAGVLGALVERLGAVGLTAAAAQAVYRRFGEESVELLSDDPYRLLGVRGVRWNHVERLGRAAGIDALDARRLAAGAGEAHRAACADGGHVTIATDDLTPEVGRLLGLDAPDARRAVDVAVTAGLLASDDGWWYTPGDLAAERGLAEQVHRLLSAPSRLPSTAGKAELDPDLVDEQASAVRTALERPVSVLTGGPGTGKTRTVVAVAAACDAADVRYALCAPTGRAAKRMEELTGRAATTVHRLLEARPSGGGGFVFGYGCQRRLPYDLVVVDEWSMADLGLAWALLRAVEDGAHVLLCGDADQLPSVGAGAVLRDLLDDASGVPATRLVTLHRQAAASRIVTLAHEVNAGQVGRLDGNMGDVFCVPERSEAIADRVAEIVAVRAPDHFDCRPSDVQVLAPMYRGPAGVRALNQRLKERLNPASGRPAVVGWHEGDRVLQTRNDAELDVANGDVGEVVATDRRERTVQVAFPHGLVTYDSQRAADLAAAWCLTVHKAQGGEWPVVVFVCDRSHRAMLWRELVYTGLTRASRALLLVGQPDLLSFAAARAGGGMRLRRTRLVHRIAALTGS